MDQRPEREGIPCATKIELRRRKGVGQDTKPLTSQLVGGFGVKGKKWTTKRAGSFCHPTARAQEASRTAETRRRQATTGFHKVGTPGTCACAPGSKLKGAGGPSPPSPARRRATHGGLAGLLCGASPHNRSQPPHRTLWAGSAPAPQGRRPFQRRKPCPRRANMTNTSSFT